MRNRRVALTAVIAILGMTVATGCVSKGMFRKNTESTESRVGAVEDAVEANQSRIGDLKAETDSKISAIEGKVRRAEEVGSSAMSLAEKANQNADKASRGKLLWTVTLSNERVKFPFGNSTLPPDAKSVMDGLVSQIKGYGKAVFIEIEGHTDSSGSEDYNTELGWRRAMTVRNHLADAGIPLHAMSTISFGESRPVADNSTREGRAQNRRVVIRVLE